MKNIVVRRMQETDLVEAAQVHKRAFPRQTFNDQWLSCNFRAFPLSQCFVAEAEGKIVGLIMWYEKSGFRQEAIVDIEQACVLPEHQGKGVGTALFVQSLPLVAEKIAERGAVLKTITTNGRADNSPVQHLCKKYGAEEIARLPGVFTDDEVYLVLRDADKLLSKVTV